MTAPYRSTPVFTDQTLPGALRREHRTKAGVWGMIHVLEGSLMLRFADREPDLLLAPGVPGLVKPEQTHWAEPKGPMKMRIDFYDCEPCLEDGAEQA
jgi:tellurite resistance-related uncharacterized protein